MNDLTRPQIDFYLSHSSFNGLRTLYICYFALKTKRPFSLPELNKALNHFSEDYAWSWIVSSISIGLTEISQDNKSFTVLSMDPYLQSKLETSIKKLAGEMDKDHDKEWLLKYSRVKMVEEVELFFGNEPKN